MLFQNANTNTKQGDIGEARAIYEYTRLGYVVSRTLFDSARYDLIIDRDGQLARVQVKTTSYGQRENTFDVALKTTGGNRKVNTIRGRASGDYDVLFVLTSDNRCWSIPTETLGDSKMVITVTGDKYSEYEIR